MSAELAAAEEHHQVVIIGGGMAGLSCALECYDIQLDTVVLEMQAQVGGQITEIPFHVRNLAAGVYDDEHPLPQAQARIRQLLERMAINAKMAERVRPTVAAAVASLG